MDLAQRYARLGRKQVAIQEGIELMREAQRELRQSRASAGVWGNVGVLADLVILPLNIIVNAFKLDTPVSIYQVIVREVYTKFGQSGTRAQGNIQSFLALLKQAIVAELTRKGLTNQIPVANILIGLAEDSLALWQTMDTVQSGSREMAAMAARVDRKIDEATRELIRIGVERAHLLDRARTISHTA